MNGEKQEYERDAESSFDWHDIRQRIINTDREVITMDNLVNAAAPQESIGFHAQQAVENILKAWISAVGVEYTDIHDLENLLAIIKNIRKNILEEQNTVAGEELYWLTEYAVKYRYAGAVVLTMDTPFDLYGYIERMVEAVYERIKQLTGISELTRYRRPLSGEPPLKTNHPNVTVIFMEVSAASVHHQ